MLQIIRGQYQLLEKIGAGGMGEVFQARDTKLNRLVAVKILRGDGAGDQARKRRFIQEAQAASALNHPNIITIYDIVSENGSEIMVMEYVAGRTLDHVIPKGGLRVPMVLHYAQQMADALRTAHTAGIIHRDLKPANVMVTEQERVKILDFGLAKLSFGVEPAGPEADPDATKLAPLTVAGTIMGTICYMSPEQAQGKPVDARSDIFSFGAVLYEMATGERAFSGDNMATMLSAVLRDEPRRIMDISPGMPAELDDVIRLCLAKNVEDRWKSMEVVHQVLTRLKQVSDSGQPFKSQLGNPLGATSPASPLLPGRIDSAIGAPLSTVSIAAGSGQPSGFAYVPPPPIATPGKKLRLSKKGWWLVGGLAVLAMTCWNGDRQVKIKTSGPVVISDPDPNDDDKLNNDKVMKLVKARASTALINTQIRNSKTTDFDLSTDEVLRLVKSGVPEAVIEQMRNPTAPPAEKQRDAPENSKPEKKPAEKTSDEPPILPAAEARTKTAEAGRIVTIPDGLPMQLRLDSDVPTSAAEGLQLRFLVAEDLKVGDDIVIARGATALGFITLERRRGAKIFGGGQRMAFRLTEVSGVEGQAIAIRNTPGRRGSESSTRPMEALAKRGMDRNLAAIKDSLFPAYVSGEQSIRLKR